MTQIGDRVSSGLAPLDAILDGGFVRKRINLIEGTPGSGKTTLGLQFLMAGQRQGEKTLYITLSETAEELRAVAETHHWSLDGIEVFELTPTEDAALTQSVFHSSEIELGETTRQVFEKVDAIKPVRMVLDSLSEMRLLAQSPLRYRRQILALKQFLAKKDVTVLLLDDMTSETHDLQVHSIAHGVITLEQVALEYGAERRRLRVRKMRGVRFYGGYHDYIIRTGGLEVFPRLSAMAPNVRHEKKIMRSSSTQLDQLLGGGLQRGTSTLLIGPAGSGKSSIALTYLIASAERGEFSALFAFDETVESIYDRSAGLGLALEPLVKAQKVSVEQINPADMSPGEFTQRVCDTVEKKNARVIVIDSLNGLLNAMPEERHLILQVHELLTYLSQRGVLTILTIAQHGMIGATQNPIDLSYLSDNVVMLRYFEAQGKLRKAISVMKKRVGSHEDSIRELRIGSEGLQVGEPLTEFQGILTGVPNYAGPQKLLRSQ
ncbi:MAG: AAA family ATPase [Alphaproteobacteria bacterium]|nr:AAA family ATPase [Alphaproteobacteria bacterium]